MKCEYPKCKLSATRLVQIEVRTAGPNSDLKIIFIPGIVTCAPHAPDINEIGNRMKEMVGTELDKLGGKRPYNMKAISLPIGGPEARAYFASKGN